MPQLMRNNNMPIPDAMAKEPVRNAAPAIGAVAPSPTLPKPAPDIEKPTPVEPPVETEANKPVSNDIIERINKLYESATALQREAEEIKRSVEQDNAPKEPPESMTPEESKAASNALLGM